MQQYMRQSHSLARGYIQGAMSVENLYTDIVPIYVRLTICIIVVRMAVCNMAAD